MNQTGKKESKKGVLKKRNKKGCDFQLELKVNASIHWTTSGNADNLTDDEINRGIYSFSMVIDSFQG